MQSPLSKLLGTMNMSIFPQQGKGSVPEWKSPSLNFPLTSLPVKAYLLLSGAQLAWAEQQ